MNQAHEKGHYRELTGEGITPEVVRAVQVEFHESGKLVEEMVLWRLQGKVSKSDRKLLEATLADARTIMRRATV